MLWGGGGQHTNTNIKGIITKHRNNFSPPLINNLWFNQIKPPKKLQPHTFVLLYLWGPSVTDLTLTFSQHNYVPDLDLNLPPDLNLDPNSPDIQTEKVTTRELCPHCLRSAPWAVRSPVLRSVLKEADVSASLTERQQSDKERELALKWSQKSHDSHGRRMMSHLLGCKPHTEEMMSVVTIVTTCLKSAAPVTWSWVNFIHLPSTSVQHSITVTEADLFIAAYQHVTVRDVCSDESAARLLG